MINKRTCAGRLAALIVEEFGGLDADDEDEEVNGADAVDFIFQELLPLARRALRANSPTVTVDVKGGVADYKASPGVRVILRDWDNCSKCGGVDCFGGNEALTVHGEETRP